MVSILSMISMCRGSSLPMTFTGHFSSASGITVWLVNARHCMASRAHGLSEGVAAMKFLLVILLAPLYVQLCSRTTVIR